MIRAPVAKVVSLALAAGIVAGAFHLAAPRSTVDIGGGGPAVEARMGSRFEDMVAQPLTPLAPQPVAARALSAPPEPAPLQALRPSRTAQPVVASAPDSVVPAQVLPVLSPPVPVQSLSAQVAPRAAPERSRRPEPKNQQAAAKIEEQRAKDRVKPARDKPKTRATDSNTRGAASASSKTAPAAATGKPAKNTSAAGNAAISNYPGQVMQRLARAGKPRVRAKGTASIAFSISASGGLAAVSVARSSGSRELDQAAVALIRKAAPFPRPPAGAQRRFSVRIKGR